MGGPRRWERAAPSSGCRECPFWEEGPQHRERSGVKGRAAGLESISNMAVTEVA